MTGLVGAAAAGALFDPRRSLAAPAEWDPARSYPAGSRVTFGGRQWRATSDSHPGQAPAGAGDGSAADRNLLLAQRSGFARAVTGGLDGATYVVTSTKDTSVPGTLRHALTRPEPLWIVFDKALGPAVTIRLGNKLKPLADKTVDGRGLDVTIEGGVDLSIKGLGTANHIWAYVTRSVTPVLSAFGAADGFGLNGLPAKGSPKVGFDLVWLHHVALTESGDGLLDLCKAGQQSRVTVDWCRFGLNPGLATWTYAFDARTLGMNNSPDNGKSVLAGLDPNDGSSPDALEMTMHHNLFRGCVQRNAKVQRSRAHYYNNFVDRWGYPPLVTVASDARYHPDAQQYASTYQSGAKKNAINPSYGALGTEIGPDGELLSQHNVYRPYEEGEVHLLSPALEAAGLLSAPWRVTFTRHVAARQYPAKPNPALAPPLVHSSGNWSTTGAPAGVDLQIHPDKVFTGVSYAAASSPYGAIATPRAAGADYGGDAPYAYTLDPAGPALAEAIDRSAGNVQVWAPVG